MIHVLVDIDETMLSVPPGINKKTSAIMFKTVFNLDAHEEMINNIGKTERGIIDEVLAEMGKRASTTEKERSFGKLSDELYAQAYILWADVAREELKENPPLIFPGIPELLKSLFEDPSVQLALLSGNSSWRAEVKLKSVGFDNYFRDPKTNKLEGVFGEMSPTRSGLFELLKEKSDPNDKFIIVDDSLLGAELAKKYNIPAIMVATGPASLEELQKYSPYVFENLGDNQWQQALKIIESIK